MSMEDISLFFSTSMDKKKVGYYVGLIMINLDITKKVMAILKLQIHLSFKGLVRIFKNIKI